MGKTKKGTALLLAFTLCASILTPNSVDAAKVKKPVLSKKKLTLVRNKSATIRLKKAGKCKVTWSSSDKNVCKITKKKKTSCKFKAVGNGSAKIKCKVKKGKKTFKLSCKVKVKPKVVTNLPSILKTYESQIPYMGTCLNYGSSTYKRELQNTKTLNFVKNQFNSFTLENEMKPDNMLNKKTTISVADAKAKGYVISDDYKESTVPELTLETIDGVLAIAKQHNIRMRAHTLMWHQQTPTWFFKKNYDDNEAVVDEATMNARLEFFVRTVMRYTMQKEKELTGEVGSIVYAWDVLNEYIHRSNAAAATTWVSVYGDMGLKPTYVKAAFEYAYDELKKENVQDKVTLFYNDYDTYFSVDDELALISYINEGEEAKICGGIGMQSHVDIKRPTLEEYGNALKAFINAGLEVQITELDITINFDTDDTDGRTPTYAYKNEKETDADQAAFTKDFIKQIVDIQKNRDKTISPKGITGITVWGISDQTSWRGSCKPLFFTRKNVRVKDETTGKYKTVYNYVPKKSYEAMIEALK